MDPIIRVFFIFMYVFVYSSENKNRKKYDPFPTLLFAREKRTRIG